MKKEIEMRRLVIKSFHIEKVEFHHTTAIENRVLRIRKDLRDELLRQEREILEKIDIQIITPDNQDIPINSIMDFSPIATKVLGRLGEGITHALTGVYVMLTGIDTAGRQIAEFGSSEGILREQVVFGRCGTPAEGDIILHVDVTIKAETADVREGINSAHRACDTFVQEIRNHLKKMNGKHCDEKHEYYDKIKPEGKKVVIVKQVAGQGAMYDTLLFGKEPGGFTEGKSIIDMGNIPILISPNEYRDGALRAMH